MGILAAGQVVIVYFPFSDLSQSKLRPAVVLAEAGRGDWLLCQITGKSYGDPARDSNCRYRFCSRLFAHHKLCATGQTVHGTYEFGRRTDWGIAPEKFFGHSRRLGSIGSVGQISQHEYHR